MSQSMILKRDLFAFLLSIFFLALPASSSAFHVNPALPSTSKPIKGWATTSTSTAEGRLPNYLQKQEEETASSRPPNHLVFPGGGIFFYWQAGVVTYLREQQYAQYDLESTTLTGASAGALVATLTSTNVDFYKATELALDMAGQAGVWDRSKGLQGIWGPMIYDWLDLLLPDNAIDLLSIPQSNNLNKLNLLVTPVPSFGKKKVSVFHDKEDLIRCNMASVHLPWFLDGKLTTKFRDHNCIDGSFLAQTEDYLSTGSPQQQSKEDEQSESTTLIFDYQLDPAYANKGLFEFVDAASPDGIYKMLEDGKRYAKYLEEKGDLAILEKQR